MTALLVGLTGGIGSGKSTVAGLLNEQGAAIIDSDAISRALTAAGGDAMAPLQAHFGPACIDDTGALNRRWMREQAFADPRARQALEAILHPLISAEAMRQTVNANRCPCLVFDVPLLVETGHWRERVDRVLVVDCSEATQVDRVTRRPGWSRPDAERVIAQQASRGARRAAADAVIDNDLDSLAPLRDHVQGLWDCWVRRH
jgi:dephospho-CoA kinase